MPFENFPYTNFHDTNLDWVLKTVREDKARVDQNAVDTANMRAELTQFETDTTQELENYKTETTNETIPAAITQELDERIGDGSFENLINDTVLQDIYKTANAKVDKVYVDNLAGALANGSPKGVFASLAALQADATANTVDGKKNIYVVSADSHWYFWNGAAWTDGGAYQSVLLEANTITPAITTFFKRSTNLFDQAKATNDFYVNYTTGNLVAGAGWVTSDFILIDASKSYILANARELAYYNSAKTFISGATYAAPYSNRVLTEIPANAKYIKFSWILANLSKGAQQVNEGDTLLPYDTYREYISEANLEKFLVDAVDTSFVERSSNLFDKSTITADYYVGYTTGNLISQGGANWATTDYIKIDPTKSYIIANVRELAYYSDSKTFISGFTGSFNNKVLSGIPAHAKYIRFSWTTQTLGIDSQQVNEGAVLLALEPFGYRLKKQLPNAVVEIKLPPLMYALVGQELNIYFDNIMNDKDTRYEFDVTCSIGAQKENYYRVTPIAAGTYPITINVLKDNTIISTTTSIIKVVAATVGNAVNRKILVIGDSTTANGVCMNKLNANFDTDVMNITMLGSKGNAPDFHEGIGGWTINNFYTSAQSPFVFGGTFNFGEYMTTRGYDSVDYVIINLGVNDVFSYQNDATLNTQINTILTQYQAVIDSIHAYNANIKIGIAITIPPAYDENSFGKQYGTTYTRWRYKRNNFMLCKALINTFKNKETADKIYLIAINANLDTRYNMGVEDVKVNARSNVMVKETIANGNVHPATEGYWQIADMYWYWLKSFEV